MSMHRLYSQMLMKVPVMTKIKSFIEYDELFWFAVCTLSYCLWVLLKLETISFSEEILNLTFRHYMMFQTEIEKAYHLVNTD